jgi:hypothetical protein
MTEAEAGKAGGLSLRCQVLGTQFDSFNCEAKLAKKAQYSNPLIRIAVYYM